MDYAQPASCIITEPSRCCRQRQVASPSASCTHSSHSSRMSLVLLVARMRMSVSRLPVQQQAHANEGPAVRQCR